jgi:hypothetical protein
MGWEDEPKKSHIALVLSTNWRFVTSVVKLEHSRLRMADILSKLKSPTIRT